MLKHYDLLRIDSQLRTCSVQLTPETEQSTEMLHLSTVVDTQVHQTLTVITKKVFFHFNHDIILGNG